MDCFCLKSFLLLIFRAKLFNDIDANHNNYISPQEVWEVVGSDFGANGVCNNQQPPHAA